MSFCPCSCQMAVLDCMTLGKDIAKNVALKENVFMMLVCISLRIPLFLVGKPGSSKSLAKSIILNSMKGQSSNCEFLKELQEVTWCLSRVYAVMYSSYFRFSFFHTSVVSTQLQVLLLMCFTKPRMYKIITRTNQSLCLLLYWMKLV